MLFVAGVDPLSSSEVSRSSPVRGEAKIDQLSVIVR